MYDSTRQRDLYFLVEEILECIQRGYSLTRVTMCASLNHKVIRGILKTLCERGIIEFRKNPDTRRLHIAITDKGIRLQVLLRNTRSLFTHVNGGFSDEDLLDNISLDKLDKLLSMIISKKRRNRLEIYFAILATTLTTPRSLTNISNSCFLNTEQASRYIGELIKVGLLKEIYYDNRIKYQVTQKGKIFIKTFLEICELLHGLNQLQ